MKTITLFFFGLFLNFSSGAQTLVLTSFGTGFSSPVDIENAGDSRLFVVQQGGLIRILNTDGTINSTPFLNLSSLLSTGGERGLLGLAFHPNYAANGYFFVNYTNTAGNTVIARYSVSANPDVANATGTILMTITQPFSNHNGGTLKFGPDGYLYIGMGDGGSGGDPGNRAQNITENLGKMLRIDVNSAIAPFYTNPPSNPYVGIAGNDEIWAIGLRNPWKFSFDKLTGDLWISDVGQDTLEEVNKVGSTQAGLNYGWRCYEGNVPYNTSGCVSQAVTVTPVTVVSHASGSCSITGGYVYRGSLYPNLQGKYLFSDYCSPYLGMITSTGTVSFTSPFSGNNFVSFGQDNNGELYIASIGGTIYKIVDTSLNRETFSKESFAIYPNPAQSYIYIEKSSESYPHQIKIFNANGKLILEQLAEKKTINTIDIHQLAKGFYYISILNDEHKSAHYKLVVN